MIKQLFIIIKHILRLIVLLKEIGIKIPRGGRRYLLFIIQIRGI